MTESESLGVQPILTSSGLLVFAIRLYGVIPVSADPVPVDQVHGDLHQASSDKEGITNSTSIFSMNVYNFFLNCWLSLSLAETTVKMRLQRQKLP